MNELPKNIDTEKELVSYMTKWHHLYSIDDFIEDYGVSERTAKELLKGIDHISITQRLFTELKPVIKRKKFYNHEELFKQLVKRDRIKYTLNYTPAEVRNGVADKLYKIAQKKDIPISMILEHWGFFEWITRYSTASSDVAKAFRGKNPSAKRNINNQYHKLAGIETMIGDGTRKIYTLAPKVKRIDEVIIYWLYLELFKEG